MNREQRRRIPTMPFAEYERLAKQGRAPKRVIVPDFPLEKFDEIEKEMVSTPERCRESAIMRLEINLATTGHPFHHLTASGVIVDTDPTLEHFLFLLPESERDGLREEWKKKASPNAPRAVPVNRMYYGVDPYKGEHA